MKRVQVDKLFACGVSWQIDPVEGARKKEVKEMERYRVVRTQIQEDAVNTVCVIETESLEAADTVFLSATHAVPLGTYTELRRYKNEYTYRVMRSTLWE